MDINSEVVTDGQEKLKRIRRQEEIGRAHV